MIAMTLLLQLKFPLFIIVMAMEILIMIKTTALMFVLLLLSRLVI